MTSRDLPTLVKAINSMCICIHGGGCRGYRFGCLCASGSGLACINPLHSLLRELVDGSHDRACLCEPDLGPDNRCLRMRVAALAALTEGK